MAAPDLTLLVLTDDDLDTLSEITEQDIVITQMFFAKVVDRQYANLLLAEAELDTDPFEEIL